MCKNKRRTIELDLATAIEWYNGFDDTLREFAKKAFSEDKLSNGIIGKNKKHVDNIYIECKKMFPIGTLVWSDEGSDKLPHIIMSEPFIDKTVNQSSYHAVTIPMGCPRELHESVYVHTVRFNMDGYKQKDIINIEDVLRQHRDKSRFHRNMIIDPAEYEKDFKETIIKAINRRQSEIQQYTDKIQNYQDEIAELENMKPAKIDDTISEILSQFNYEKS